MATDEYHEALLDRIRRLQDEIATLPQRDAWGYAYLISQEIPEEAARMLVAEMLMDFWTRHHKPEAVDASVEAPLPGGPLGTGEEVGGEGLPPVTLP